MENDSIFILLKSKTYPLTGSGQQYNFYRIGLNRNCYLNVKLVDPLKYSPGWANRQITVFFKGYDSPSIPKQGVGVLNWIPLTIQHLTV